jgi:hypothetical protein
LEGDDPVLYFLKHGGDGGETRFRLPKVWTLEAETVRRFLDAFLKDTRRSEDRLTARQDNEVLGMLPFFSLFAVLSGIFLWRIARRWELAVDAASRRATLSRWTLGRRQERSVGLDQIVAVEPFEKTEGSRSGGHVEYHLKLRMRDGSEWRMPVESPGGEAWKRFVASVRWRVSKDRDSGEG